MKNLSKKIMALMLCTVMLFSSGVYGVKASGSEMDAYAADIIGDMLMINGCKNLDDITISNGIAITDIENPAQTDKKMYFALDNSEIVGTLIVECIDGEYYSSFNLGAEEEIYDAYSENEAFALFCQDACLIMRTSTDNRIIENDSFIELDADSLNYPATTLTRVYEENAHIVSSLEELNNSGTASLLSTSPGAYTVNDVYVPFVTNGKAVTGVGMCFTACVASISNYRTGTSYTANSLYNKLWINYSGYGSGDYPVGTLLWINRAFVTCNLAYNYEPNGLTGVRISDILSTDRPIYMSMVGTDSEGERYGHAVVLHGIYVGARNYYLLMDPNVDDTEGKVVIVSVTDDALNNAGHFVYTTEAITYTNWRYSFY